jgi:hypothetical protein
LTLLSLCSKATASFWYLAQSAADPVWTWWRK